MVKGPKANVVYRPALLLKDGTLLQHSAALAHFQLFTLSPNLNVATFKMKTIACSGGLDSDGVFHPMSYFSESTIQENMDLQKRLWETYSESFDKGGTKQTWEKLVSDDREKILQKEKSTL